jgi:hypothetical protein
VEAAIEPERVKIPVNAQESLLVHVPGVFRRPQQVHGQAEHTLIVGAHKLLESILVPALGGSN